MVEMSVRLKVISVNSVVAYDGKGNGARISGQAGGGISIYDLRFQLVAIP
jgi:hypothetical protein